MKVIALEEHLVSPLYASTIVRPARSAVGLGDRSKRVGHDVGGVELLDVGASRIRYMDASGIDVQVLSLTMPGAQAFGAADAPAIARDANHLGEGIPFSSTACTITRCSRSRGAACARR